MYLRHDSSLYKLLAHLQAKAEASRKMSCHMSTVFKGKNRILGKSLINEGIQASRDLI